MRGWVVAAGAVVAALLAAGVALAVSLAGGDGEHVAALTGADDEGLQAAERLTVDCSDEQATVSTRRVHTHADGVHVRVTNLPDDGTSVELASIRQQAGARVGSGASAYANGDHALDGIGSGPALLRCTPIGGPRHMMATHEDPTAVPVEIVDPDGHWIAPRELQCGGTMMQSMIPDYGVGPDGVVSNGDERGFDQVVAAGPLPVSAGDEIAVAGYAEGSVRWAEVVRDGRVVARAAYSHERGSWLLRGMDACAE